MNKEIIKVEIDSTLKQNLERIFARKEITINEVVQTVLQVLLFILQEPNQETINAINSQESND